MNIIGIKITGRLDLFMLIPCAILLLFDKAHAQETSKVFTPAEKKILRKCKGSPVAFYHGKQLKEYTRLMNLARINPKLLVKYVTVTEGQSAVSQLPLKAIEKSYMKHKDRISILRPSFCLHLGSFYHAVASSINGQTGHQNFQSRLMATLNFNTLLPGVTAGENVYYGSRDAIDIFTWLINSPGHRDNILSPDFMRVGASKKGHPRYQANTVTMFSGPKIIDWVFHNKEINKLK